jgi:HNH endonuclease
LRSPQALRQMLLGLAVQVLSGPGGLAAALRAGPGQPFPAVSLPLDVGAASEVIPAHLRRLIILRDQHCRFPGCHRKPSICQVHHLIHREDGGVTSLENCALVCRFHHLIAIHRWGWKLTASPDGSITAFGPDGRILRDHAPPQRAA